MTNHLRHRISELGGMTIDHEPMQRTSIIAAPSEWPFAPPVIDGRPTEVETGLTFPF
jgi:hypothetical protein